MQASPARLSIGRRAMLLGLAAGAVPPLRRASAGALPVDRVFEVFRKGERIGTHAVTFRAAGGGLAVRHDIDLVVKLAFIPIYHYRQQVEDRWAEARLVATDADTDDNGERSFVRVRERGARLVLEGPRGTRDAPLGTMNDLSFWNAEIVRQRGLIDCQKGILEPLALEGGEAEEIIVGGRPVAARRWRMNPRAKRGGEVWYDEAGRIVQATVRTRGEVLAYRLVA